MHTQRTASQMCLLPTDRFPSLFFFNLWDFSLRISNYYYYYTDGKKTKCSILLFWPLYVYIFVCYCLTCLSFSPLPKHHVVPSLTTPASFHNESWPVCLVYLSLLFHETYVSNFISCVLLLLYPRFKSCNFKVYIYSCRFLDLRASCCFLKSLDCVQRLSTML